MKEAHERHIKDLKLSFEDEKKSLSSEMLSRFKASLEAYLKEKVPESKPFPENSSSV